MSHEPGTSDVVDEFIAALRAAGEPPCTGCRDEFPCAEGELACSAYAAYVDGEDWLALPRKPSHEHYAAVFPTLRQREQRDLIRERQLARRKRRASTTP